MRKKELLARIEELERKVAELELANACKPVIYVPWQEPQEPAQPYRWICDGTKTAPVIPFWGFTATA